MTHTLCSAMASAGGRISVCGTVTPVSPRERRLGTHYNMSLRGEPVSSELTLPCINSINSINRVLGARGSPRETPSSFLATAYLLVLDSGLLAEATAAERLPLA